MFYIIHLHQQLISHFVWKEINISNHTPYAIHCVCGVVGGEEEGVGLIEYYANNDWQSSTSDSAWNVRFGWDRCSLLPSLQHPSVPPAARRVQCHGAWAQRQRQEQPGRGAACQRVPEVGVRPHAWRLSYIGPGSSHVGHIQSSSELLLITGHSDRMLTSHLKSSSRQLLCGL